MSFKGHYSHVKPDSGQYLDCCISPDIQLACRYAIASTNYRDYNIGQSCGVRTETANYAWASVVMAVSGSWAFLLLNSAKRIESYRTTSCIARLSTFSGATVRCDGVQKVFNIVREK